MRQILQSLKNGETLLAEVPCPALRPGHLLIRTQASVVSVGTERMLVGFGKANYLDKARQQPEKVRQVLDKVKSEGLFSTLDAVKTKLDNEIPLGYCNAGIVEAVGSGVEGFQVGDRVISNGPHAEVVCVPYRLCAAIPPGLPYADAAFAVLGAIGLQGIRLCAPSLGERVAVIGLGTIGLLCVQMLRASGCSVLAIDLDTDRCTLARELGATAIDLSRSEDPLDAARSLSGGAGLDAVLITAATRSSEPVATAAHMCRKRGRIVLVGVAGLELDRADFYQKELSFQVSCSYGPGRYDPDYELDGNDYPIGFVRWTEQRNFEAVLEMLADGRLQTAPLLNRREPLDAAPQLYEAIAQGAAILGAVLDYPPAESDPEKRILRPQVDLVASLPPPPEGGICVGVLGAGSFCTSTVLPVLKKDGVRLRSIASQTGASAGQAGRKFGFEQASTDAQALLDDPAINTVFVTTRHDSHADYCIQALERGKSVWIEKPLALRPDALDAVAEARSRGGHPLVMVGFNRRFAPLVAQVKELIDRIPEPKAFVMTVNAGRLPDDHWSLDPKVGGGRLVGEGCHWVDLLRFLAGCPIQAHHCTTFGPSAALKHHADKATITFRYADGSMGTLHYLGNGSPAFPKERLEVFVGGRILQLDNFRSLRGWGFKGFGRKTLRKQDKGHSHAIRAFLSAVQSGGDSPIPFEELIEVSRISMEIEAAGRGPGPVE